MPVRFLPLPPVVVRHGSGLVASFGFPFMVLMVYMSGAFDLSDGGFWVEDCWRNLADGDF